MRMSAEVGRVRRQQIVNLSITELMLLLVFMAVTFSFLAKEENLKEVPYLQKRVDELTAQVESMKAVIQLKEAERIQALKERDLALQKVAELERTLRQLLPDANAPSPNGERQLVIPESKLKQLRARIDSLEKMVGTFQRENADLRRGGKAPGRPLCVVTSHYLLSFILMPDGSFVGEPAWDAGAQPVAPTLPGVSVLASGKSLTATEFESAAGKLKQWTSEQDPQCTFTVIEHRRTTSIDIFEQQLNTLGHYFYFTRAK